MRMSATTSLIATAPVATVVIMAIALVIAIVNTAVNRALISYFVGWDKYRTMQKEIAEFRKESMAAARSSDKKQMEKIKKKQSQINSMTAQMAKPQMVQLGISFVYIVVWWFVLIPLFGNTPVAAVPGFGSITVVYWYPITSFFLGLLMQRVLGTMPIE
jgi:uncharacterized membrane protein (DUF106 family)